MDYDPRLGLATTRQLLQELKARGEVSATVGEYPGAMKNLEIVAEMLLDNLPEQMLNYKTVGENTCHE
jgi:hypothetical protein